MVDDGTAENSIGLTAGGDVAWMNQFTAVAGLEVITDVEISFGTVPDGVSVDINIWNDPNNDGDPTDGQVVATASTTTMFGNTSTFIAVDTPDVTFNVGDNFFVGAFITHAAGDFPAAIDQGPSQVRSWIAGGDPGTVDVNNLGAAALPPGIIDGFGLPGNWLVRANGTAVPEPASASLLVICGLALGLIRRR